MHLCAKLTITFCLFYDFYVCITHVFCIFTYVSYKGNYFNLYIYIACKSSLRGMCNVYNSRNSCASCSASVYDFRLTQLPLYLHKGPSFTKNLIKNMHMNCSWCILSSVVEILGTYFIEPAEVDDFLPFRYFEVFLNWHLSLLLNSFDCGL